MGHGAHGHFGQGVPESGPLNRGFPKDRKDVSLTGDPAIINERANGSPARYFQGHPTRSIRRPFG
jgi:hypothetical protein